MTLTVKRLREVLRYDPETGEFWWLQARGRCQLNHPAGSETHDGYISIRIDGRSYQAHRLAWLYVTGFWPAGILNHRDTDRANNAFSNLRECSSSENLGNSGIGASNTSGVKGVHFYKQTGRWSARIMHHYKHHHLGYFDSIEEAARAYQVAAVQYLGGFARIQ